VRPGLQLVQLGFTEGILVAERVSGLPVTPIDHEGVPRITSSSPEVASVRITSAVAAVRNPRRGAPPTGWQTAALLRLNAEATDFIGGRTMPQRA
jgi:pyruvate/2-oxoglutarate dehydrogenase complex dihydrolipoamide dehydrogenase (E3) component